MWDSFTSLEPAVEGGGVILHLTFTCLEGARKKLQVPDMSLSTNYSMSWLCLHFCEKVAAELNQQVSGKNYG